MPTGDIQFWIATGACALAVLYICRGALPARWRRKKRGRRVSLTVGGKAVGK